MPTAVSATKFFKWYKRGNPKRCKMQSRGLSVSNPQFLNFRGDILAYGSVVTR